MIAEHEWLNLAVKNAQRNVAEFIEQICERHLSEHRAKFLPKIEHVSIDESKSLNRLQKLAGLQDLYNNQAVAKNLGFQPCIGPMWVLQ